MNPERKIGMRGGSRFDAGQRHYHRPGKQEKEAWDEWTGDKVRGPWQNLIGNFLQFIGTIIVACAGLVAIFYAFSFLWKMVFPMISK